MTDENRMITFEYASDNYNSYKRLPAPYTKECMTKADAEYFYYIPSSSLLNRLPNQLVPRIEFQPYKELSEGFHFSVYVYDFVYNAALDEIIFIGSIYNSKGMKTPYNICKTDTIGNIKNMNIGKGFFAQYSKYLSSEMNDAVIAGNSSILKHPSNGVICILPAARAVDITNQVGGIVHILDDGTINNNFNPGGTGFTNQPYYPSDPLYDGAGYMFSGHSDVFRGMLFNNNIYCITRKNTYYNNTLITGGLVKLSILGEQDLTFKSNIGSNPNNYSIDQEGRFTKLIQLQNGTFLAGGVFLKYNNIAVPSIVNLSQNGTFLPAFSNNLKDLIGLPSSYYEQQGSSVFPLEVTALYTLSNGSVIICYDFHNIGYSIGTNIFLVNEDGTVHPLHANIGTGVKASNGNFGAIRSITELGDNTILMSGNIKQYNTTQLAANKNLIKLSSTFILDTVFDNNIGTGLEAVDSYPMYYATKMEEVAFNKVLIAGPFTHFNGTQGGAIYIKRDGTRYSVVNPETYIHISISVSDDYISSPTLQWSLEVINLDKNIIIGRVTQDSEYYTVSDVIKKGTNIKLVFVSNYVKGYTLEKQNNIITTGTSITYIDVVTEDLSYSKPVFASSYYIRPIP